MNRPVQSTPTQPEPTTRATEGWHCLHLYYRVNQTELNRLDEKSRAGGREELKRILDPDGDGAVQRLQTSVVSGHKADLGLLIMDPDPLAIDSVKQSIRASTFGPALVPVYSFVSLTDVSEYVPTAEQYAEKLRHDGADPADPVYAAKIKAYEKRLPAMNERRLYPEFPAWPVIAFYPMNKIRHPLANWYREPFSRRSAMMAQHATSGIKFAGRVTQLVTASTGFDDWEWGVTLWSRSPEFVKEIVYTMRYDEASARYAEFGPFYVGYVLTPSEAIRHLRL